MKKKLLMLVTAIVMIACSVLGLVACSKTFDAPANVKVDGSTLKWDAVDGAESYTVKINADETTNNVKATSLDLTTVTAKLKSGENTLAVKANASGKTGESEYSATVKYTYTPTPEGKTALNAPTNVKVDGDTLKWDAVTGATNGYTVKINTDTNTMTVNTNSLDLTTVTDKLQTGDNTLSVKANATQEHDESAYATSSNKYTYTPVVEKPDFAAPTNVKVEGDTLKWDAVTGATNGYTVKINTDTNTMTVNTNTLDLTTITDKLQTGDNTLYVKVNATEDYNESAYAESSNKYAYNPDVDKEIADLVALVEAFETALATFNADKTVVNADAVLDAITAVETKYNGISQDAKAQVEQQATEFIGKSSAFTTTYNLYKAFVVALNATLEEVEKEESLPALNEKVEALKTAKGALSGFAAEMVTSTQEEQGASIDVALTTWTREINATRTALTISLPELTDDESAEQIVVATADALAAYASSKAYVKNDSEVAEKYATISGTTDAAIQQLTATVTALKADIDVALENTEATQENYNALVALQARAAELGAYASQLFDEYKMAEVNAAVSAMIETVVEKEEYVSILINPDSSDSAKIVIVLKHVNVLGEVVEYDADSITASAGSQTLTAIVVANANDTYTVEIPFGKSLLGAEPLVITYQIGSEAEATLKIAKDAPISYFPESTSNKAYKDDGKIDLNGDKAVIDVYLADEVDWGDNRRSDVTFSGFPIIEKMPRADLDTLVNLKGALARIGYIGEQRVRLVAYRYDEDNGVITVGGINNASVSAIVEVTVVADDARLDIFHEPNTTNDFTWELQDGDQNRIKYAWQIVSNATLWDGVDIYVYDIAGISDYLTYDFLSEAEPFAVYHISEGGFVSWTPIDEAIMAAWKAVPYSQRKVEYTFVFAMHVTPNDEAKAKGYQESLLNYATKDGARDTKSYNMTKEISSSVIDAGIWGGSSQNFSLIGTPSGTWLAQFNNLIDEYELTAENAVDYFEILVQVYSNEQEEELYFSIRVPFKNQAYGFAALKLDWTRDYFTKHEEETIKEFNFVVKFSVVIKEEVNGEANKLLPYFTPSSKVTASEKDNDGKNCRTATLNKSELTAPNDAQIGFDGNGNLTFVRANGNGSVFTVRNADKVLLEISNGSTKLNLAFFYEDGKLTLYRVSEQGEKEGAGFENGAFNNIADSWCTPGDFNNFIKSAFSEVDDISSFDCHSSSWSMRTKVIVGENSSWLFDSDWSDAVSYQPSVTD